MGITMEEALALETLKQVRVVAGRKGLSREIRWVTILEVLDEINALHEGELLVTTAFGLSDIPGLTEELIPILDKRKLAGLAIQTGYYLDKIPATIIRQCDALNFPLLELPKQMIFSDITMAITKKIINRQTEMLEYAQQIHDRLTMVILKNKGLPQVTNVLAELINAPVRILDTDFNLITYAGLNADSAYVNPENIHLEYKAMKKAMVNFSDKEVMQALSPVFPAFPAQILQPLRVGNDIYGYISVLTNGHELKDMAQIAISSAATISTLEILKAQAVWEAEERIRGDFIDDLLENNIQEESSMRRRAKNIGLNLSECFRILILSVDNLKNPVKTNLEGFGEHKAKMFSLVRFVLNSYQRPIILKDKSNKLIILLPVKTEAEKNEVASIASLLRNTIRDEMHITVSLGIGQAYKQLSKVSCSFHEAEYALSIGYRLLNEDCVLFYENLGLYSMFANVVDPSEMQNYYLKTVAALIQHDVLRKSELVATLEAFHKLNNSITDTAKKLYVHRHTLKYRLNRIRELTGLDPENAQDQFQLLLGLVAARLLSKLGPIPLEMRREDG